MRDPGLLHALLALEDDVSRQELAEQIVSESLSVREVERRAAAMTVEVGEEESAGTEERDSSNDEIRAGVLELEELLSTRLDTRVSVQMNRNQGKITIGFGGLPDLERIYHIIMQTQ